MNDGPSKSALPWLMGAMLLVVVTAAGLRYGTNVLDKGPIFDEQFIVLPIRSLIDRGWSVETAIDFTETKGPTMIWLYAVGGSLLGGELNTLRLFSVLFFVGGAVPLLLACRRCGLNGPASLLVTTFYLLLPNAAPLGQLLMSEPSFIFGSLWLIWVFLWGFGDTGRPRHPVLGPIAFAAVLAALLHLRIHAVAFAGAAALVAFERDRWRSWPWWLACVVAGGSRAPLLIRWGGLVAPEYQTAHGLGVSLETITYLGAGLAPYVAIFLWPALLVPQLRARWGFVAAGAAAGLVLAVIAAPSLADTITVAGREDPRFLGAVATLVRTVGVPPGAQAVAVGVLAILGLAGLGALAAIAWQWPAGAALGALGRLQFWTFVAGCALYGLTRGAVYDRYLMPWAIVLPVLWVTGLPRGALALQGLALAAVNARFTWRMLIRL